MAVARPGSPLAVAAEVTNQAPQIALVSITGAESPVVHVRRGQQYTVCRPGARATAEAPCEPGATAVDPDGMVQAPAGNNSLDLTSQVVVCPPIKCLTSGCSPLELRRHTFAAKGLQGCGIDTSAPEGTQFKVEWTAWLLQACRVQVPAATFAHDNTGC